MRSYVPAAFVEGDQARVLRFVRERSFATVIATGGEGAVVAFAPVLIVERDGGLTARFHLARGNPVVKLAEAGAVLTFLWQGPDAYVSPDWYVSADQVPTWNFLAAMASGPARVTDEEGLRDIIIALSHEHEARLAPKPIWTVDKMTPGRLEAMMRAIIGIDAELGPLEAKFKLSQNKKTDDIHGVIAGLEARGDARSLEISAAMRARR